MSAVVDGGRLLTVVDEETRGQRIRRRRLALGIKSYEEFAEATGMSRGAVTRAEKDDPTVSETTYERLEIWLTNFEHETGSDASTVSVDASRTVRFSLAGNFGVEVVVEGPVEDMAEMREQVSKLVADMERRGRPSGGS